ncbi:MAG: hypothetical protein KI790_20210, partial [Cyclobacteriaceae bacterium]|nr:hypothetical protein [Cyclobacteriaceae bacterium HetDA_MAG_MS6]
MAQTVQNGMVDLSQYDFTKNGPFALNGSWVFYPDALLSKSPSNDSLSIQVPGSWEKADLPAIGFGTYELTIIQQSDVSLGLDLPNIHSALNLYVNDQLVVSKGQVSIAKDSTIPYRQVRLVPLFNFGDTLHLRIEVANFHHSRGGVDDPIVIGNYLDLSRTRQLENVLDVFLTGCLVMGSFLFLGLYFFGRRQVVALFFGLFCLSYGYRIIGSGSYILHDYFYVPHWLSIRLEYAAIYLSGYFFAEYVRHLFPKETPRYLISFFCYFSLLWAALTLLPPTLFTQLNTIYLFVLLMAILTMALVYIRAVLNRQVGAGYSVFSTIGMLIVFSVKVLAYLHVIEEPKMVTMAGQLVFFLFQSLILPDRFSTAWRRSTEAAKTANEELKATQNQLIESEKMATIGILTAGLAHELNNPLNVIGGVIGPIKRVLKEIQVNGKGKAKKKEVFQEIDNLLDHVSESAKRATQVIRNLLDIT